MSCRCPANTLRPVPSIAKVLVEVRPLEEPYDYAIPPGLDVAVGSLVRVDFAGRSVRGWVTALTDEPGVAGELKALRRVLGGVPVADSTTVELAGWAAGQYGGSAATVLGWATPEPLPRLHRKVAPSTRPSRRPHVPELTEAVAEGRHVEAFVRTWPSDDAAATVAALAAALPPGRSALVVSPPAWAPQLPGAVHLPARGDAAATRAWESAVGGTARVVTAGRHGPFVPVPNLGLVVVTAAHSDTHKDHQAPALDARVTARELARRRHVPFVAIGPTEPVGIEGVRACASAAGTDTVELTVPGAAGHWPSVEVVDMRAEPPGTGALSSRFFTAVRDAHRRELRTLVFLNRTGTARALVCSACGAMSDCPTCGSLVTPAPGREGVACGRCGWESGTAACRVCGSARTRRVGLGVDKLHSELGAALAGVQVLVASGSDAPWPEPGGIVVGTRAAFRHRGAFDLVLVVDPDASLARPGLRAEEAAFGMLVEATGCARGRSGGGRVLLQTRRPGHPAIGALAAGEPARYEDHLLISRGPARLPPFRRLLAVSSTDPAPVDASAQVLRTLGCEVFGPRAEPRPQLLALVDHDVWLEAAAATRAVALDAHPARVRIEADPLDPL